MKPFVINDTNASRKVVLPIQFMRFGVEDQEIIVPIRKRDKGARKDVSVRSETSEAQSNPPMDLSRYS